MSAIGSEVLDLDRAAAERRAERIRLRLDAIADNYATVMPMIREAIEKRDDLALGYRSPGEYVADRFGGALQRLGVEVRREVVRELTEAGMSTRAIAPVVGVSHEQVRTDQRPGVKELTPDPEPVAAAEPAPRPPVVPDSLARTLAQAAETLTGAESAAERVRRATEPARRAAEQMERATEPVRRAAEAIQEKTAPITGIDGKTYPRPDGVGWYAASARVLAVLGEPPGCGLGGDGHQRGGRLERRSVLVGHGDVSFRSGWGQPLDDGVQTVDRSKKVVAVLRGDLLGVLGPAVVVDEALHSLDGLGQVVDGVEGLVSQGSNIRTSDVAAYARDMASGKWQVTGEAVKFDRAGNLIDGQHRMLAVVRSGATVQLFVVHGLSPVAQSVMDSGLKRAASDALHLSGYKHSALIASVARLALDMSADGRQKSTHSEIARWVEDNADITRVAPAAQAIAPNVDAPPTVIAYTWLIFARIDPAAAAAFWESIANQATDGDGDPRSTLIKRMAQARRHKERMARPVQIGMIIRAWNAWRKGESVRVLRARASSTRVGPGESVKVSIPEAV